MSEPRASIWIPPAPATDARAISVLHSGYLSKKGDRNMFSWKNRFFTLKSNGDLIYYENASSSQSLGSVPISATSICCMDPKSPLHFTVQAAAQTRKYVLRCDTADDCTLWMSKLSELILSKKMQTARRLSRSVSVEVSSTEASSSPTFVPPVAIAESDDEEQDEWEGDGDSLTNFERELNAMGMTTVSRGSLQIHLHGARRSATYWFELLHGQRALNYYNSNSNHRSSFVGSIAVHSVSLIPSAPASSPPNSFIISHGGARQTAPIHHIITAPSPSALSFWLDAFTTVTDNCLSRDAIELRRRKAVLQQQLVYKRLQRPSLQLIAASLQDFDQSAASSYSSSLSLPSALQSPTQSSASATSSQSSISSLFNEEGDGGEAIRCCLTQLVQLRREPIQVRCVILDRFTRPASAPYDSRYNADVITYNPPILALLTVGGLSSSSSSIGVDGFRVSLVDDSSSSAAPSNRAYDSGGSLGTIAGAGAAAEAGKCLVDAADVGVEGGGRRMAFSVAACAELHVAFDADFTEEWLPVTLHMMQLDLASSFTSSYSKVEYEQLVVFSCRMVGRDAGELLQVLDERARAFNPFTARAADIAAAAVRSTRIVFSASSDEHMHLLRRIWSSVIEEMPFPGHDHPDWENEIGFQGKQPHTDLRKMGVFALEQLAYFAENYTERFDRMRRFGDENVYPAATVSVGISDMVMSLLNCSIGPAAQATAAKAMASGAKKGTATDVGVAVAALTDCTPIPRSFLLMVMSKLLQGGVGNPLHELHSACMIRFSLIVDDGNYKYMDINSQVMPMLRQSFLHLISTFPKDVYQLQSWSLLGSEMLVGSSSFQNIATAGLMQTVLKD